MIAEIDSVGSPTRAGRRRWRPRRHVGTVATLCAATALGSLSAVAQTASPSGNILPAAPIERETPTPGPTSTGGAPAAAHAAPAPTGILERSNLLGDAGGLRPALDAYGISLGLTETSEVLGSVGGGLARGAIYEGLTQMTLGVDLGKAAGLEGGSLNVSAFQIHGRGLSANYLDNLNVASGIEADRSTRLFELWYDQSLWGGAVDLRVGQQSADQEFMLTQYGSLFINASFGWPTLPAVDLPSGGPAYPLATPAVRLKVHPTDALTAMLGVYNGNPAGNGPDDPQIRDASGTSFDTDDGVFVIGETDYAINQGDNAAGLPGTYKLGAWYNSNAAANPYYDAGGLPADGSLPGGPATRRNDWSIYAGMDQLVYRAADTKDGGVGVFARIMGAPDDRNDIDFFVDGGVSYKGVFGRAGDTIGLGLGLARIGDTAQNGDAAFAAATGSFYPIRTTESVIELTYQAQLTPWWVVQPDFQYIFNPGGGILDPSGTRVLDDAAILGARTVITF
jgi:porin